MASKEVEINAGTLAKLVVAKQPTDTTARVNSLTFSSKGDQMIMSTDDDSIFLYDINSGNRSRNVNSKKYGCSHVKFASDGLCALHGSTKVDNTIRYLSLTDNKYIRYFQGHDKLVTGINVSPLDDMFLSVAQDKTIRLWDLKTHNCIGLMNLSATPIATFDPEGLLFAAGLDNNIIKLYDLRSFDKGPFSSFGPLENEDGVEWTAMRFSPCGKYILICTNSNQLFLVDAFSGVIKYVLQDHQNIERVPLMASFVPDSSHVMVGSSDGLIYFYDVETGLVALKTQSPNNLTCHIAEFSPRLFVAATTDAKLALWCANDDLKARMQL
uniref:WD_REPEATS_REGION domain-containing protein n=1 Tax=Caenorhabditis tropicalis TaxID=1561998 RepID=A0A1I7SXY8_9PELO